MQRELSIEERINLMTLAHRPTKRHTVESVMAGSTKATIADVHARLDQRFIPRYTECPWPLNNLESHIADGKRLDVARVSEDGSLTIGSEYMQKVLFNYALTGKLKRIDGTEDRHQTSYVLTEPEGAKITAEKGDFLIHFSQDFAIHIFTVSPEMREKANQQSEGAV